jgi:preprotein translocase subunit Sss1
MKRRVVRATVAFHLLGIILLPLIGFVIYRNPAITSD